MMVMTAKVNLKKVLLALAAVAALVLALIAVVGLILFKQHEYRVSGDYYDSLRSMRAAEGAFL